jgi:proteasome lid subunit RPN8/RPN11
MTEHTAGQAPLEACGILAGLGKQVQAIYPIKNVLKSRVRFRMDPHEQLQAMLEIEKQGMEMLAIYHSHPNGPPKPSATDLQEFAYPGVLYIIWTHEAEQWSGSGYQIENGQAVEIALKIGAVTEP